MTIVLAAIAAKGDAIVMASDRMLSTEELDYQFEHEGMKVRRVGKYLVGYSGPASFADDILSRDWDSSQATMKDFVKALSKEYIDYSKAIANRVLLEPYDLSFAELKDHPTEYPELRERVFADTRELQEKMELDFIVCGYDGCKPKLYLIGKYGVYSTAQSVGYAAVGIGTGHAENFYMVSRFRLDMPLNEAIFFAFRAKKSTEISAGIGKCTDICILERGKEPVFHRDGGKFVAELDRIYDQYEKKQDALYRQSVIPKLKKINLEDFNETV